MPPMLERIMARATVVDMGYATPCWISDRAAQPNGYTKIGIAGRTMLTHRVAYEAANGPIPDGLVVDHLCRNRACARPDHLELVTNRENLLRGEGFVALEAQQTHCHRGHEFTLANTHIRRDRPGRGCRICRTEATRRSRQR